MIGMMAALRLTLWSFMACIAGPIWSQSADLNFTQNDGGVHHALMAPHRNPFSRGLKSDWMWKKAAMRCG